METTKRRCTGGSHGAGSGSHVDGGAHERVPGDRCCLLLQLMMCCHLLQSDVDQSVSAAAVAWAPEEAAGLPDRRALTCHRQLGNRRPSGGQQWREAAAPPAVSVAEVEAASVAPELQDGLASRIAPFAGSQPVTLESQQPKKKKRKKKLTIMS